jgi:hypothetical protein
MEDLPSTAKKAHPTTIKMVAVHATGAMFGLGGLAFILAF